MSRFFKYIVVFVILIISFRVFAQNGPENLIGPATIEYGHKTYTKIDSTGGLQVAGGVWANPPIQNIVSSVPGIPPVSLTKKDLDPYRGPDVLNPCAYFETTFIASPDSPYYAANSSGGGTICGQILSQLSSSSGGTSGTGSSGSGSSSGGACGDPATNDFYNDCTQYNCAAGQYYDTFSQSCQAYGITCDSYCRNNIQDPGSGLKPSYYYVTGGGSQYKYDLCYYQYDKTLNKWIEYTSSVYTTTTPEACPVPGASSGGGWASESGSSGSSSGGATGTQVCPPSESTGYQFAATADQLSNQSECTFVGNSCIGHCETDIYNPGVYQSLPIYRVSNGNFAGLHCTYSADGTVVTGINDVYSTSDIQSMLSASCSSTLTSSSSGGGSSSGGPMVACPSSPITHTYQSNPGSPPNINLTTTTVPSGQYSECTMTNNTCAGHCVQNYAASPLAYKSMPYFKVGTNQYIYLNCNNTSTVLVDASGNPYTGIGSSYSITKITPSYTTYNGTAANLTSAPCQ